MTIEKILPDCIDFVMLEVGECFVMSNDTNASVFLKVNSDNSRKNAVNLTNNILVEISSNIAVIPVKATLTISEK